MPKVCISGLELTMHNIIVRTLSDLFTKLYDEINNKVWCRLQWKPLPALILKRPHM